MPEIKARIIAGRKAVDTYRRAHARLYSKPWRRSIPEEHTPLLIKLVEALERQGFSSSETEFKSKKTEILAKFFDASELLNIQELGFASREDFEARAIDADKETLNGKWK